MNTPEKEGPGGETGAKDDGANQSCCTNSHGGGQKQGTSSADPKSNGERPPWFGIEISMVGSATETKTESVTISSVLEDIRDGRWKNPVGRVKENYSSEFAKAAQEGDPDPAATAKKSVNGAKKELPGILFSGKFSGRANDKLEDHSGFLGLDLDNLGERLEPLRQRLKTDPRVQVFFVSPTGTGLKVLLRIHPDKDVHRRSFEAAKGYFREAYDVGIDNCPDVSRLCYVCHDPDIFIRAEDAIVLEPLPEEAKPEPEFPSTKEIKDFIGPKGVILPSGDTDYTDSASMLYPVLKASKRFFVSNGLVGTLITHKNESRSFNPISDHEFCSAIERPARLFAWRVSSHGKPLLKPKERCSTDQAKKLLAAEQRFLLPNIIAIHNCPILAEMPDGRIETLGPGYHSHGGGRLVTGGDLPTLPSLEEAIGIILDIVEEVSWLIPPDQSRWICAFLEPAFKSLCDWPFPSPLFIMEADASQAGKGFLLNLISVTYREFPTLVTQSEKGVGGFDESLSHAFLEARPIILFDNFRGSIKSTKLEASITCPIGSSVAARVPYRPETRVDPHNYIFQLTSNGLVTTEDLANRSCISRILYQGERGFARYPEGSILEHVRANQPKHLGAAHRIVREWCERGKQFSSADYRGVGSFRPWWQRSDWILTQIFGLHSPVDGHNVAQKRAANPTLGWLRELFIKLKNSDLTEERGLSATDIFNFCELSDIEIPCRSGEASKDERGQVQRIGKLLGPLFSPVKDVWQGEGFSIKRIEEPYYDPGHGEKTSKRYLFFEGPEPPDVSPLVPQTPSIGPLAV